MVVEFFGLVKRTRVRLNAWLVARGTFECTRRGRSEFKTVEDLVGKLSGVGNRRSGREAFVQRFQNNVGDIVAANPNALRVGFGDFVEQQSIGARSAIDRQATQIDVRRVFHAAFRGDTCVDVKILGVAACSKCWSARHRNGHCGQNNLLHSKILFIHFGCCCKTRRRSFVWPKWTVQSFDCSDHFRSCSLLVRAA